MNQNLFANIPNDIFLINMFFWWIKTTLKPWLKVVSLLKHLVTILLWLKSFLTFLFGLAYHLILQIKNKESLAVFQIFEFLRRLKDSRREISLFIMSLRLLLEKFQTTYPQKNFPISVPKSSGFCFSKLTLSDMTLLYSKVDPSDEANCIPVSIFPLASEVFENHIQPTLLIHENFGSKFLCSFCRVHSPNILYKDY